MSNNIPKFEVKPATKPIELYNSKEHKLINQTVFVLLLISAIIITIMYILILIKLTCKD